MSDTNRLNIGITATNDPALQKIQQLLGEIKGLDTQIRAITAQMAGYGSTAAGAFQKVLSGLQQEVSARQQQIGLIRDSISAMEAAARAARQERDARVEAALGPERAMQSAASSARTLATSLSIVAEADGRLRQEAYDTARALDVERAALLGVVQARAAQGARVGVPGGPPSGLPGAGLTLTPSASFTRMAADLAGVQQSFLNAEASAAVFQRELGAVGSALTLISSSGFPKVVEELVGMQHNTLSAAESARVFERELGKVGDQVRVIASGGFSKMVADLAGVKDSLLSAAESARAFEAALGPVGAKLTLIQSSGFNRMAADLAGVKMSYLSAADSARVFQQAGLTATETALGMTEVSVAAAARLERAAASGAVLGREMRHVVGVFDAFSRGQFGQALSSVGAGLRDAGTGAVILGTSVAGLVGIMAGHAILRGAENMGRWATETRAAASAAGMSLSSYSQLQGALGLLGLKTTEADATLRQLAEHLGGALADETSHAARGFHALGISQEQLVQNGSSVTGILRLLSDAWGRTTDSATKSAAAEAAMGRGFEALVPLLQQGATGTQALMERAKELGTTLDDETAKAIEDVGQSVVTLGQRIHGNAIAAMVAWGPTIKTTTEILGGLLDVIGAITTAIGYMVNAVNSMPQFMARLTFGKSNAETLARLQALGPNATEQQIRDALAGGATADSADALRNKMARPPGSTVPPMSAESSVADRLRNEMTKAAEAASAHATTTAQARQLEAAAEIGVLRETLQHAKLNAKQREEIETQLTQRVIQLRHMELSAAQSAESTVLQTMRTQMAQAAEAASKGKFGTAAAARQAEERAEIAVMEKTLRETTLTAKQKDEVERELAQKRMALTNSTLSSGISARRQDVRDFIAAEKEKIAEADGSSKKIQAIYEEMLNGLRTKYAATAAQIATIEKERVQAVNSARLQEIEEGARHQQQLARLSTLNQQLGELAQHPLGMKMTPEREMQSAQRDIAQAQSIRAAADKEIAALKEVESAAEEGSALQRKAAQEILSVEISTKSQELELYRKAGQAASDSAKRSMEGITRFFDSIGSSVENFTSDLTKALIAPQREVIHAGMTTITRSMRGSEIQSAFAHMITSMVSSLGRSVQEAIGGFIAKALSGGAANTIGELLSQTLGKVFGSIFGSSVGSLFGGAAGGAASAAATSAAIAAASTAEVSAIATGTATTLGGLTALGTTIVGAIGAQTSIMAPLLAAVAVKPSILGFSYSEGGIVPSAAGGMVVGGLSNKGLLSILHPQEMVLPAPISRGFQDLFARSQTFQNNLNYSPTINTNSRSRSGTGMSRGEFHEMLAMHSGGLLGEARNMVRNGWRPQ